MAADRNVEIWGFAPHMHQRGRGMNIELQRGEERVCGANVDRYDFAWQSLYFLEQPLLARASDELFVTCDWDTRADAAPVRPGFTTAAEMCTLAVYVVAR